MTEAANLQFLRCPNCENLLPELPDFSLYNCGGCGAVLEAKQKGVLEIPEAVKSREILGEALMKSAEAQAKGKERIRKLESSNSDYASYPQGPNRSRNQPYSLNVEGPEYVDFHRESLGDFRHPPMDQWGGRTDAQMKFGDLTDFRYYEEGQSSYEKNSYYDPSERNGRYRGHEYDLDGLSRMDNIEDNRAELIRRIDELRDQISRSCDISDKSKERLLSSDPYSRLQGSNYFPDDVSSLYFNEPREYTPYRDRYNPQMPMRRHTHDLTHYSNNKSFRREIPYRPPQSQYSQHHPYHGSFSGHYRPVPGPGINENFFQVPQKLLPLNTNDVLSYQRPKKFVTAHKNAQMILPVAGGAPFIVCTNCFETLKLPKECVLSGENGHKVKCGACSSIIMFKLNNTGITALSVPTDIDENSSGTLNENVKYWNDDSNSTNPNAFSNDYDNVGDKKSNSELLSGLSEDEKIPEVPVLTQVNSPDNIAVDRFDKGNKSQRLDRERISLERKNSQEKFVKDASVATEIDVSNEFTNSCESQDSVEVSREAYIPKLIKRNLTKDSKQSNQTIDVYGSEVFVNGHFIPDRIVRKAEKLAGPIQPGEYWYDKRAGFWGVMGHPCLGIIMPNIEEFHHPMPQKCAAGNTEVFINGRELHHKDLDLLCKRGLPIAKQRAYIVEITGKVIDEETGEELDGLGKLAPTVEKSKHGFGMKIPRFIAQIQSQE